MTKAPGLGLVSNRKKTNVLYVYNLRSEELVAMGLLDSSLSRSLRFGRHVCTRWEVLENYGQEERKGLSAATRRLSRPLSAGCVRNKPLHAPQLQ